MAVIKLLNTDKKWKYSLFGADPDTLFNYKELGLHLSFRIYLQNQTDETKKTFKEFISLFFSPNPKTYNTFEEKVLEPEQKKLPYFLPVKISEYNIYGNEQLTFEKKGALELLEFLAKKVKNLEKESEKNLIIIQGESGSGKTTLMLGIAHASRYLETELKGFLPVYLNFPVLAENNNVNQVFAFSFFQSSLKFFSELTDKQFLKKFLHNTHPLLFFFDTTAINRQTQNESSVDNLIKLLKTFSDLLKGTEHKLVICHRGTMEGYKHSKDSFYEGIKDSAVTWEVNKLEVSKTKEYIKKVGGEGGKNILKMIEEESENILEHPLFADFLILMSLSNETVRPEIKSVGHLYLLFTRELLNLENKILGEKQIRENVDTWLKLDESANELFNNTQRNSNFLSAIDISENRPVNLTVHPIELVLQQVSLEDVTDINSLFQNLLCLSKIKEITEISDENKRLEIFNILNNKWLDKYRKNIIKKIRNLEDENESINQISRSILENTFLTKSGKQIEFFHPSIEEFYEAFSVFFNLKGSGEFIPFTKENKTHFENNLINLNYNYLKFFVYLLEIFSKDNSYPEILLSLNLNEDLFSNLGKFYWYEKRSSEEALAFYNKAKEIDPLNQQIYNDIEDIYIYLGKFENALEIVIESNKNIHGSSNYNQIINYYQLLKRYDKAIEVAKESIEFNPQDPNSYYNLGHAYLIEKEVDEAIIYFKKAIEVKVNYKYLFIWESDNYFELGIANLNKGDKDKAIEYFKILTSLSGLHNNPNHYNNLGRIYYYLEEYNKAIEYFEKVWNKDIYYYFGLSNANYKTGNIDKMVELYDKFFKSYKFDDESDNYIILGHECLRKGETDKAFEYFETFTDLSKLPRHNGKIELFISQVFYEYCDLGDAYYKNGNIDKAIEKYKKDIKEHPNYARAYINIGSAYSDKGMLNQAIDSYKKAISIEPDSPYAYGNLGLIYFKLGEFDNSINNLEKAISIKFDYVEAHYNMGLIYKANKEFDKSIQSFNKAIEIKPNFVEAHIKIATDYFEKKMLNEAIESYKMVIELKPDYKKSYFNIAESYFKLGNYDQALEMFEKFILLDPNFHESYLFIASIFHHWGNLKNAIENYQKAIYLNPNLTGVNYAIGLIYFQMEEVNESVKYFEKEIGSNINDIDSYKQASNKYLGKIYGQQGKLDQALEMFEKYLFFNQSDSEVYLDLGSVYELKGMFNEAINAFNMAIELNPESEEAFHLLGNIYFKLSNYYQSVESFKETININPGNSKNYYNLGTAYEKLTNIPAAVICFQKAISLNPKLPEPYINLGFIFYKIGKFSEAIIALNKAIFINQNDFFPYKILGGIYANEGNLQEAIKYFEKSLLINPIDSETNLNIGITYRQINDLDKAIEHYNKAISIDPMFADTYYCLGIAYDAQGKIEMAIESYEKSISINPNNEKVYCNLGGLYAKKKIWDKAMGNIVKALIINPNDRISHYKLNDVYNEIKEEIEFYIQEFKANPNNIASYYNLSARYSLIGEKKVSLEFLKFVIVKDIGYKKIASKDEYFEVLWDDPDFQGLVS